jgi:hypothetical protein
VGSDGEVDSRGDKLSMKSSDNTHRNVAVSIMSRSHDDFPSPRTGWSCVEWACDDNDSSDDGGVASSRWRVECGREMEPRVARSNSTGTKPPFGFPSDPILGSLVSLRFCWGLGMNSRRFVLVATRKAHHLATSAGCGKQARKNEIWGDVLGLVPWRLPTMCPHRNPTRTRPSFFISASP